MVAFADPCEILNPARRGIAKLRLSLYVYRVLKHRFSAIVYESRGLEQLGMDRKTIVIAAIKTQIAYRKKVLLQKIRNAKLWNFSEGGVMFSPAQMIGKLKVIIREPLAQA